jgi:hypothetical protein
VSEQCTSTVEAIDSDKNGNPYIQEQPVEDSIDYTTGQEAEVSVHSQVR